MYELIDYNSIENSFLNVNYRATALIKCPVSIQYIHITHEAVHLHRELFEIVMRHGHIRLPVERSLEEVAGQVHLSG